MSRYSTEMWWEQLHWNDWLGIALLILAAWTYGLRKGSQWQKRLYGDNGLEMAELRAKYEFAIGSAQSNARQRDAAVRLLDPEKQAVLMKYWDTGGES